MITVVTVNYRCASRTLELLRSLELQTVTDFSVIVVDNDSGDDDRRALGAYAATTALAFELLPADRNLGFSGGNNLALRKALAQGAQRVVLLNPDTTVAPDFIKELQVSTDSGITGLPIAEPQRTVYGGIVRWLRRTLPHATSPSGSPASRYAIGAAMVVGREVFGRVGLLDERFFLYFEDAEFSLRARRAGFKVAIAERPSVRHEVSGSTRSLGAPLLLRYHARNALLFNRLCGPWWVRALLPFWALFGIVYQLMKEVLMPSRRPSARAIRDGISDYYAGRFGRITDDYRH